VTRKSEAAALFRKKGAVVFDADVSARQALSKGSATHAAVLKLFGKSLAGTNGQLDRKKLAWHVFTHPEDLKKLNTLVHPGVIFDCLKVISSNRERAGVLVLDVPLLFESRMDGLADFTVVVKSPLGASFKRSEEKGIPRSLAKKILSTQWPIAKKAQHADFVIDNAGSLKELERKVLETMKKINVQSKGGK
jgi:dephospho-CoA kinase